MNLKFCFLFLFGCSISQIVAQKKAVVGEDQKLIIQSALGDFVIIPGGKFLMGSPVNEEGRHACTVVGMD